MGGRSRKQPFVDRWDWVKDLSDNRLDKYGQMSCIKSHQNPADESKRSLNYWAAQEFERRKGYKPTWYYQQSLSASPSILYKDRKVTLPPVHPSLKNTQYQQVSPGHTYKPGDLYLAGGYQWEKIPESFFGKRIKKDSLPVVRVGNKESSSK